MRSLPLDLFDDMPREMKRYRRNHGFHFTKNAYEYAVSLMRKDDGTGKEVPMLPISKEELEQILAKHKVVLNNNVMYDAAFVYMMAKADYYGSSIEDEEHLALFVKDYLDDVDAPSDTAFRRWMATCIGAGIPIDWIEIF